jgi:hypothetical protein
MLFLWKILFVSCPKHDCGQMQKQWCTSCSPIFCWILFAQKWSELPNQTFKELTQQCQIAQANWSNMAEHVSLLGFSCTWGRLLKTLNRPLVTYCRRCRRWTAEDGGCRHLRAQSLPPCRSSGCRRLGPDRSRLRNVHKYICIEQDRHVN